MHASVEVASFQVLNRIKHGVAGKRREADHRLNGNFFPGFFWKFQLWRGIIPVVAPG